MPVHTKYYVCNHCHKIGVFQRIGDGFWLCRYCGQESTSKQDVIDDDPRCNVCNELLPREAKQALDFFEHGRPIMPEKLWEALDSVVASNAGYVQGMSPNSSFLAVVPKLLGAKAEGFIQAAEHSRRYHRSQIKNLRRVQQQKRVVIR